MRVVGYTRVSTEEQGLVGTSLEAQAKKIRSYCRLHDLELVDMCEDLGASARSLSRPGLRRAFAALDDGHARGLVVTRLDRLTRSVADMATLISMYFGEEAGYMLFSVTDSIDARTAAGRMVLNILVSVSQWEREAIAERTRDVLRHKAASLRVYGPTPLGYRAVRGRLVEDRAEIRAVRDIRRMATAGYSLRRICAAMNAAGHKTKRGGRWRPSTVQAILRRAV